MRARRLIAGFVTAAVAASISVATSAMPASAVTGSDWNSGNIIADSVFYYPYAMTADQIQTFLNSQGTNCVAGQEACLKNYRVTTASRAANAYCGAYAGASNETAAQIISKVATACGINPRVFIVLLQKEQSLVTKTQPTTINYRSATGYGCPDGAACDTQYYGLYNQIYMAGWQYNYYRANPGSFGYQAGRNNTILYNPNTACGSSTVYIANQATAGLYIYTPYQPNAAALANIGGLGNSCSSYGNINFWRLFNDWFGSTQVNVNVPYMPTQADRSVIVSLYQDFLGRAPDAGGFAYWLSAVAAGASQAALVQYTVSSREYAQLKVTQAYRSVLLRDPDPGGLTWWINTIMSGGATIDDVAYRFYLSPEFYAQGGGTDSGYVQHMYDVMLGRPAGQSEIDYWVGFIATYGRNQSTTSIWFSLEAAKARAAELYRVLLHREPDAGGLDYWAHVLIAQGAQAVRVGIAGSPEYRALAVTLYPNA